MANGIRMSAPKTASKGEVIELKSLIQHDMESGYRLGSRGEVIPRKILQKFECLYNGDVIFEAEFHRGVAANPFLTFYTKATETGTLTFKYTEETGTVFEDKIEITVT